jgi:TonB family protein
MWVDACRRRDGEACLRLMAITAATPSIADAYAHHACSYGVAAGCEMRGTDQLLRALPDGDRGALREAAQTLGRACEADDWSSCLWEALAAGQPGADKPADYAQARRQRAFELAATACDARDATACGFRAETLSEAGQAAAARSAYAKGCMVVLTSRTDEPYAALLDHPVCQRAHKLAVAPPEASATPSADGARALPASALESRRASGDAQVEPDHDVRTQLQRVTKATRLTTEISLCVSRAGLVREVALWRSSGFAPYDRQVLQAARGWRFRPYLVQGAPTPVCSQVSSSHQHHPSLSEPQKRPPGAGGW